MGLGFIRVLVGDGHLALLGHGVDLDAVAAACVVEFVSEGCLVIQVEVSENGDDSLDHVGLAGAVLTDDGVALEFEGFTVGRCRGAGEGDLEISQVAKVLDFEAFELHYLVESSFM